MSRRAALVLAIATLAPQLARADDDPPMYACRAPAPGTMMSVTFKPETDLRDLVTWALGFTCKNIIIDAQAMKYGAKMTVIVPNKLTPKQAFALFVDAVEATGLVVVQKGDTVIIKLGPKTPRDCALASAGTGSAPPTATPVAPQVPEVDTTAAEIAAGIKVIDATHREVTRAFVDRVLANPMGMSKGARFVPAQRNDKPYGFKLYAIRPDSVYDRLGFANGDTLVTINGTELTSADKALDVYTSLRDAAKLDVAIERRGKPMTISIAIKP